MKAYPYRHRHNPWTDWFAYPLVRYPFRHEATTKIRETQEAYYVEVWLPGLRRNDIQLIVRGEQLEIEGVRNRHLGFWGLSKTVLQRSVILPPEVDTEKIDAKFRHGRLLIRLSKTGSKVTTWHDMDQRHSIEGIKRAVAKMKLGWDKLVSVMKHGL